MGFGIWIFVSPIACAVFATLYVRMSMQDILYKWPYAIRGAYRNCTACFRRRRAREGDLEAQVGGVNPVALRDLPTAPEASTSDPAPLTPEEQERNSRFAAFNFNQ